MYEIKLLQRFGFRFFPELSMTVNNILYNNRVYVVERLFSVLKRPFDL